MSVQISPVTNNQSFGVETAKLNQIAAVISTNTVTTAIDGSIPVTTGNAAISGTFGANTIYVTSIGGGANGTSSNTLNISTNALFTQNATFNQSVSVNNNLTVNGNTYLSSLNVSSNAVIFNISSNGFSTFRTLSANLSYANTLIVARLSGGTDINTAGPLLITTNTTVNSSFIVVNTLSIFGNTFANSLSISNTLTTNSLNATTLSVTGNTVLNNYTFTVASGNNVTLSGNASIAGNVTVGGNLYVTGNLISSSLSSSNFIPTTNNVYSIGNTSFRWQGVFANTDVLGILTATNLTVSGNSTFFNVITTNQEVSNNIISQSISTNNFTSNTVTTLSVSTNNLLLSNNFIPASNGNYSLGNTTFRWNGNFGRGDFSNGISVVGSNSSFGTLLTIDTINNRVLVNGNTSSAFSVTGTLQVSSYGIKFSDGTTQNTAFVIPSNLSFNVLNANTFTANSSTINNMTSFIISSSVYTISNAGNIYGFSYNTPNTSLQVLDSFPTSTFRAAEYYISSSDQSNNFQTSKFLIMHNGISTFTTEFASLNYGSTVVVTSSDVNSGNVRLLITPSSANVNIKVIRTLINI